MPYNNTPIEPSKEITGTVSLPLARVQRIINADPERLSTSKNASFAIALATEMFVQHLATTTHNVVKTERKPRRNIQYRDVAAAVGKTDNLEFAADVVPRTVAWKEVKKRAAEGTAGTAGTAADAGAASLGKKGKGKEKVVSNGQAEDSVNGKFSSMKDGLEITRVTSLLNPAPDAMDVEHDGKPAPPEPEVERVEDSEGEDGAAMQIEMEMRGPPVPPPVTVPMPLVPLSAVQVERRSTGFTAINGGK